MQLYYARDCNFLFMARNFPCDAAARVLQSHRPRLLSGEWLVAIPKDADRIFREDRHLITEAIQQEVRDALERHAKLNQPVVIYRNGKIEWVPAMELLREQPTIVAERPEPDCDEDE